MIGILDLSHNRLTGCILGSLGTLSFLDDLDLSVMATSHQFLVTFMS